MMRYLKKYNPIKLGVLLGTGAGLLTSCSDKVTENQRPNVVVILADDIGYGDLSCYGTSEIPTPNVDKLAGNGIRFTNAHSVASTSTPSRYSLFTGHYAWRRDDTGIAAGDAGMIIRPEQFTVADMFSEKGYATAAIGKWHLGLADKTGSQDWNGFITPGPSDIGFQYSYIMAATADRVPCAFVENQRIVSLDKSDPIEVSYKKPFAGEPTGSKNPELLTKLRPSHGHDMAIVNGISRIGWMRGGKTALWTDEYIADSITDKAVQYIENHKDKPFFMYVGTNDIHVPRYPNPRFQGKSGHGLRGDAILQFDWTVGEIIAALERAGVLDNTLIILTSDNGPVVDDGYIDQSVEMLGNHKPWGVFRGGKYSNFEAGTRVPMIVSWKGKTKCGLVSDALVSQIDLAETLAEVVDFEWEECGERDGQNEIDAWLGRNLKGRDYIIEFGGSLSISDHEWKYIVPSNGAKYNKLVDIELGNDKAVQLYNLKNDIGEKNNVADSFPEVVERMEDMLFIIE